MTDAPERSPEEVAAEEIAAEDLAHDLEVAASPFGRHEAMHTASVMLDMFERHVLTHPAVEHGGPEIADAAQATFDSLIDFYQLLGATFLGEDEEGEEAAPQG